MRKASIVLTALFLSSFALDLCAQATAREHHERAVRKRQTPDSPPAYRTSRPKLSLQDALKIAERYIDQEHIDISSYWLYRAIFILAGNESTPDKAKLPCWHFWWVNDSAATGDYVEIMVTMDGKAWRAPSM